MAQKLKTRYVCQNCGYVSPRWLGKCPGCDQWNTLFEEVVQTDKRKLAREQNNPVPANVNLQQISEVSTKEEPRANTNIGELDRVLGGGIVPGSVILIGGDPGIGKSTLMLQIAEKLSHKKFLYVSGEESALQIKMRAERLNYIPENFYILAETSMDIIQSVILNENPDFVVIDSIQTVYRPEIESSPGTIVQLRESTSMLIHLAKTTGVPVFVVGHITKEGAIAGPKILEHMVDVVLQFEGERTHLYRILRGIKNRFGSTNEIGIFEMTDKGLQEVLNPSEVFLSQRNYGASGCVISSSIEGTRPILIEVQALVTETSYGFPQRTSMGYDIKRLNILIAVLEKKLGLYLNKYDIFVNVAGGVKIDETAVDLAIASSIYSSYKDIPVDSETVVLGEVGLAGEVRTISGIDRRINEADKLGFKKIIIPKNNMRYVDKGKIKIQVIAVDNLRDALKNLI
ncbi:MAG TPA: DNA repair protein RadA [Ignavibacteria bacterium]|nr:DNA repair protein RadA [Ignavibacteria bacterium]